MMSCYTAGNKLLLLTLPLPNLDDLAPASVSTVELNEEI